MIEKEVELGDGFGLGMVLGRETGKGVEMRVGKMVVELVKV